MIINPSEYIKSNFFKNKINKNIVILSDSKIETENDFIKFDVIEPVWQILALAEQYEYVFVILYSINYDNIFRLYKNNLKNVCVINLNSWYTWLWKKITFVDLDDIYIKHNVEIKEIMDLENFKLIINDFLDRPRLLHIRVPSKEMEEKIWNNEIQMDYFDIIDFSEFWINWYSWLILSYWSMLQETLNAIWLMQSEGINMDLVRLWDYKKVTNELLKKMDKHDKIFIVWDFDVLLFKDYLFSKIWDLNDGWKEIFFITPTDLRQVIPEFLSEQTKMQAKDIYNRIINNL